MDGFRSIIMASKRAETKEREEVRTRKLGIVRKQEAIKKYSKMPYIRDVTPQGKGEAQKIVNTSEQDVRQYDRQKRIERLKSFGRNLSNAINRNRPAVKQKQIAKQGRRFGNNLSRQISGSTGLQFGGQGGSFNGGTRNLDYGANAGSPFNQPTRQLQVDKGNNKKRFEFRL